MSWDYVTLDKLGTVARGKSKHRPRNDKILFGGKYPFIQTADVKAAELYLTEYNETYSEKGLEQSKLWPAGTLCITIAANIADTAILGIDACFPDSVMGFIPFEGISNVKFVKYAFDILQRDCQKISQGTARDNLSWKKLSTIKFPAPPIEVQNKIVEYLSTYDDLIENNRKQIKLLEEMAQRLYKEWFVDLHFPRYEDTPIVDGVPEGWHRTELQEVSKFTRGKTITKKDVAEGDIPVVAGGLEPAYYHNKSITEAPVITVSGSGANAGFTRMYYQKIWASDCSYIDVKGTDYIYFTFCLLRENKKILDNLQKGAAQPHVYAKDINALDCLCPTKDVLKAYEEAVTPIFNKIADCIRIIEISQQARDRLLPKLMSGDLEV